MDVQIELESDSAEILSSILESELIRWRRRKDDAIEKCDMAYHRACLKYEHKIRVMRDDLIAGINT